MRPCAYCHSNRSTAADMCAGRVWAGSTSYPPAAPPRCSELLDAVVAAHWVEYYWHCCNPLRQLAGDSDVCTPAAEVAAAAVAAVVAVVAAAVVDATAAAAAAVAEIAVGSLSHKASDADLMGWLKYYLVAFGA